MAMQKKYPKPSGGGRSMSAITQLIENMRQRDTLGSPVFPLVEPFAIPIARAETLRKQLSYGTPDIGWHQVVPYKFPG